MKKYICIGCSKRLYLTENDYDCHFINPSHDNNRRDEDFIICFDCFNPNFIHTLERIPNLDCNKYELDKISKKNKKVYKNERMYKMVKEIHKSLNL